MDITNLEQLLASLEGRRNEIKQKHVYAKRRANELADDSKTSELAIDCEPYWHGRLAEIDVIINIVVNALEGDSEENERILSFKAPVE